MNARTEPERRGEPVSDGTSDANWLEFLREGHLNVRAVTSADSHAEFLDQKKITVQYDTLVRP